MAFRKLTEAERVQLIDECRNATPGSVIQVPPGVRIDEVIATLAMARAPLPDLEQTVYNWAGAPPPPKKQSFFASNIEQITNILVGLVIQLTVLWFMLDDNHTLRVTLLEAGVITTSTSYLRSLCIRRLFEHLRVSGTLS